MSSEWMICVQPHLGAGVLRLQAAHSGIQLGRPVHLDGRELSRRTLTELRLPSAGTLGTDDYSPLLSSAVGRMDHLPA
jgi:hypothetical protein